MFPRLFCESGLSLDRLRSLVEVAASGSIVRAAGSDTARQSQYSRQIKELEDFFQIGLVERYGKGIRLTSSGRELARISRFFFLGLSNFQRGCLAEGQFYRLGGPPTFNRAFLLPVLAYMRRAEPSIRFAVEGLDESDIERRLHDLTLDFAVVTRPALSRPLQVQKLGDWGLSLWVPRTLGKSPSHAARALAAGLLPVAWPTGELPQSNFPELEKLEPAVTCGGFLEAKTFLETAAFGAVLPHYLKMAPGQNRFFKVSVPWLDQRLFQYGLAWNPRLMRLNPHSRRRRDTLLQTLTRELSEL